MMLLKDLYSETHENFQPFIDNDNWDFLIDSIQTKMLHYYLATKLNISPYKYTVTGFTFKKSTYQFWLSLSHEDNSDVELHLDIKFKLFNRAKSDDGYPVIMHDVKIGNRTPEYDSNI